MAKKKKEPKQPKQPKQPKGKAGILYAVVMAILMGLSGSTFTFAAFVAGAFTNAIPGIIVHIVFIPVLVLALRRCGLLEDPAPRKTCPGCAAAAK